MGFQTTQGLFPPSLVLTEVRVIVSTPLSIILWWSVLFVEETRVPGENHRLPAS